MNAIGLFKTKAELHPEKMAVADIKHGIWSFRQIEEISSQIQALLDKHEIKTGDSVLVAIAPSPVLYGTLCGLMGLGIRIVFIEPWLSLDRIQEIIELTKPKAFLSSTLGKLWGLRSKAIRQIPLWISSDDISKASKATPFRILEVDPELAAFIVFSSGTTGTPKGIVRSHQYMKNIFDIFIAVEPEPYQTPDLIIFPNVALFHLATGRGSIIVPQSWKREKLEKMFELCEKFGPQTLSTGPAFLKTLLDLGLLSRLKTLDRMVIGGALTDCWIMEKTFETLPDTRMIHIYGGSEAEPVAVMDARVAVKKSRAAGFFQTICLGEVIPQLTHQLKDGLLWVSGPNVSQEYIGDPRLNEGIKERDAAGRLWHNMGDRALQEDGLLWYMGREKQSTVDFLTEQKLYSLLNSSKLFLHRAADGKLHLVGEKIKAFEEEIRKSTPSIDELHESKIIRDKRHRSRIDRARSLPASLQGTNMSRFAKWNTYLKERSPLPALIFVSMIGAISSLSFRQEFDNLLFCLGFIFNTLIFVQLRLGDEIKDFEKDKIVNPTRPLPRGLLSIQEVTRAMIGVFLFVALSAVIIAVTLSPLGGLTLLATTVFGWLMYKEFYVGEFLAKEPMTYALTHQVMVFALYAWIGLTYDQTLIHEKQFLGWLLANFGASFTFEICRKLNPRAHAMAGTYALHYGRPLTALFTMIFITIMFVGSWYAGFGKWLLPFILLLIVLLVTWIKNPEKYKTVEGVATLTGLLVAMGPAIMWLMQRWQS